MFEAIPLYNISMNQKEEIKKLKEENFKELSPSARMLVRLGILRYWAEQDADLLLFKRRPRWWNPLTWLWLLTAYTLVMLLCILSVPVLVVGVPFEGIRRACRTKISGGVAMSELNVEKKEGEG